MKTIFGWIFNRWVFGALGLVALSLLIWYGGGLIEIAKYAPLESETARIVLIAIVVLVFVLRAVWKLAQAQRQSAQLTEGLLKPAAAAAQPEPGNEQVAMLDKRFEEAIGVLKQARSAKTGFFAMARQAVSLRSAVVRLHRCSRYGQDNGGRQFRPAVSAGRQIRQQGDQGCRGYAQLRLVVHRRSCAARYGGTLHDAGKRQGRRQRRMDRLPQAAGEVPVAATDQRRDRRDQCR